MKSTLLVLLLLSLRASSTHAGVVSTSDGRLPSGLSTIVADLQAQGCASIQTACLMGSATSSPSDLAALRASLVGEESSSKAVGLSSGLLVATPAALEVPATAAACGGQIVFVPSPIDLARGEGLMDALAPAMEQILASGQSSALVVVAEDPAEAQAKIEAAANVVLPLLLSDKPVQVLSDVFSSVSYVSSSDAVSDALGSSSSSVSPEEAAARIANSARSGTSVAPLSLAGADLAAARRMGPLAQKLLESTYQRVESECRNADGSPRLVEDFGELCRVAIAQATDELSAATVKGSGLASQIRSNLASQLKSELSGSLLSEQMDLLLQSQFDEYKKGISKLILGPNLAKDMDAVIAKNVAALAKKVSRMGGSDGTVAAFRSKCKEHSSNRIQTAQANGQFRPLPRKGVTVGMHWLLPKPFGNDYRQEPWMVHATDNMVYIPKDKITDINPDDVAAGDWRSKIVPSPVGNDMLYMQ